MSNHQSRRSFLGHAAAGFSLLTMPQLARAQAQLQPA
ncbi:twin-arginine translocation pathway signal, partial [Bradyrhizobium genosp. SA-3]